MLYVVTYLACLISFLRVKYELDLLNQNMIPIFSVMGYSTLSFSAEEKRKKERKQKEGAPLVEEDKENSCSL